MQRCIAITLMLSLLPLPTLAQTDVGARAKIEADSIKGNALARLEAETSTLSEAAKLRFQAALQSSVQAQLTMLRQRYEAADAYLNAHVGYGTPWYATWKRIWNNQEAAAKVFQDLIEAAVKDAQIPAAREQMEQEISAALTDNIVHLYKETRETFNRILYDAIAEKGLLGPLAPDLVKELVERIDTTSQQLAVQDGVIDANGVAGLPSATTKVIGAILVGRMMQAMMARMGVEIGAGRIIGGRLASLLFGPLAWVAVAGSTIYDIINARSHALDKCKEAVWKSYNDTAEAMLDAKRSTDLMAAVTAGLEVQLQTDRKSARIEIDRFIDGYLVQAASPGYLDFAQSRDKQEALRAFRQVVLAFGRNLVEVPFFTKYDLVSDMPTDRAGEMIKAHGKAFVEMYAQHPEAVKTVMTNHRYTALAAEIFQDQGPETLRFFKGTFDRFGALDAKSTDALLLLHRLLPGKRPDDIHKDTLIMVGRVYDRMAAIAAHDPQLAATVLEWVIQGQMSAGLMQKLANNADAELLLALPVQLGVEPFTQIMKHAREDVLLLFVRDFTVGKLDQSQAVMLLREDGPGHLAMYAASHPRGVLVRHAVMQEYGGRLTPEAESTLRWLVLYTSIEPHRGTIESLHTMGIPRHWPDVLARPMAGMVGHIGLMPSMMVLAMCAGVVVLVPVGAFRFRLLRLPFGRRRKALAYQDDRNVVEIKPVRRVTEMQALPEHHSDERRTS